MNSVKKTVERQVSKYLDLALGGNACHIALLNRACEVALSYE